jgi:hypothetical protein
MQESNNASLVRVAQLVDQLVDDTISLLILRSRTQEQLALALKRERTIRTLQEMMHEQASSSQVDAEQWWQIVAAVIATSVAYTVDGTSDSILYKRCLAHACMLLPWRVRMCSVWS